MKATWSSGGPTAIEFTLGNAALGVTNLSLPLTPNVTVNGNGVRQVTLGDGRIVSVFLDTTFDNNTDFSWLAYGNWSISSSANVIQNGSVYVTGFETPLAGKPTTGTATFNGFITGATFFPNGANLPVASLNGTAQLTANWATGGISGTASSIVATPLPAGSQPTQGWNGLTFSGTITSGTTAFSGTTTATGNIGSTFALTNGATGTLNGQFYGTTAQEVGALWSVNDGTRAASGYLVAKQ